MMASVPIAAPYGLSNDLNYLNTLIITISHAACSASGLGATRTQYELVGTNTASRGRTAALMKCRDSLKTGLVPGKHGAPHLQNLHRHAESP